MGSNHRRARLQRAALPLSYLCEVKHSGKRVFELVKDTGYRTRASLPARPRGRGDPAFAQRMSVQFGKVWIPASAGMSGCGNSLTSLFAVVKIQRCKKHWSGRGESNSSSTRRQRATLPLSYGRGLLNGDWWAGMDSNHLRMNGAFTERWARQCPACPSWRRSEVLIPSGSRHPSRFERAPDSCPVTSPYVQCCWRKAAVLIRNARGIQSASDGCRPPGRSTFQVVRPAGLEPAIDLL